MRAGSKLVAAFAACVVVAAASGPSVSRAQVQAAAPEAAPAGNLYAVEVKTGPAWDGSKPAHEQVHFREHSANLRLLRDQGSLVLGARYADKGLLVLRAASELEAHAMMLRDPAVQNRVFAYELHEFNVFYAGSVQTKPRRP